MITVHHLEQSRSHRILWLLEELGLDYEIKTYKRHPKTLLAPKELKAVHPLGKSPMITLDDGSILVESGAIVEYLVQRHTDAGLTITPDQPGWKDYLYWLHYAEGSLMPLLVMTLVFRRVAKGPMPFFVRPVARAISAKVIKTYIQPQINDHLSLLEQWFGEHEWAAGDSFSAADIQLGYPLDALASRSGMAEKAPVLAAYIERLRQRPAYQVALQKGGPISI